MDPGRKIMPIRDSFVKNGCICVGKQPRTFFWTKCSSPEGPNYFLRCSRPARSQLFLKMFQASQVPIILMMVVMTLVVVKTCFVCLLVDCYHNRLLKGQHKPLLDPDYALRVFFGTKKLTFKLLANPGDTLRFFFRENSDFSS